MKTILFLTSLLFSLYSYCQDSSQKDMAHTMNAAKSNEGIQFDYEYSWKEILDKAMAENKMIYVDAYTTWCAPCKMMDMTVFNKKEIGDAVNSHFISFKAQIDTGKNDNDYIKAHYADFSTIAKQYNINYFPTHLFINSNGELVHKVIGGSTISRFSNEIKNSLDPQKQFYTLKKQFDNGERSPELLFNLSKAASGALDAQLSSQALDLYITTEKNLFAKENIDLIFKQTASTKNKSFDWIKNNKNKIDNVMGTGSTNKALKRILTYDILYPELYGNSDSLGFKKIHSKVTIAVDKKFADDFIKYAKCLYYLNKEDHSQAEKSITAYGPNNLEFIDLYSAAQNFLENSNDKKFLQKALQWALLADQNLVSYAQEYEGSMEMFAATINNIIANLYFKNGQKAKAIEYEEKALALAKENGDDYTIYEKTLQEFKNSNK